MKKYLLCYRTFVIILVSLVIISCRKSNEFQDYTFNKTVENNLKTSSFTVDRNVFLSKLNLLVSNRSSSMLDEDSIIIANLHEVLDSVGAWHNEFQSYMFENTVLEELSLCGEEKDRFRSSFNQFSSTYFGSLGIEFSSDFLDFYVNENIGTMELNPVLGFSNDANELIEALKSAIEQIDFMELQEFVSICEDLKDDCFELGLSVDEQIAVGCAIVTAKYSAIHWSEHFTKLEEYYSSMECSPNYQAKMSPNEKAILQHDAAGAIGGAISGLAGGPAVAVASGLVVGGWKSCVKAVCIGFKINNITDWFGW